MATTLDQIRADNWAISLDEPREVVQGVDEISQCILIILSTQKGSDPFRPEFGCDILPYLDLPIQQAKANLIRAILEAIQIWEQRVAITNITTTIEDSHITFNIEWTIAETDLGGTTAFSVNTQ